MSFGDYSFAGGHVGIAHKMSLKCTRNLAKYTSDMSPRGDSPQNPIESRSEGMENKAKIQPYHLIFAEYHHGPSLGYHRRQPNEAGLIRHQPS